MMHRKRTFLTSVAVALSLATLLWAQTPGPGAGPRFEAKEIVRFEGTVESVNFVRGEAPQTITLDGNEIIVSPFRRLLATRLKISEGDLLQVDAFASPRQDGLWVAVYIVNLSQDGAFTALRDRDGAPLARIRARRHRPASGNFSAEDLTEFSGQLTAVNEPAGGQPPSIVLGGNTILVPGIHRLPEGLLTVGDTMTVKAFESQRQEGVWIAVQLTKDGESFNTRTLPKLGGPSRPFWSDVTLSGPKPSPRQRF